MNGRKPAAAGQFYPARKEECLQQMKQCLSEGITAEKLPETIRAGIVPHAGWVFSGPLAGSVFSALSKINNVIDTFIIFGAAHRYFGTKPAVYRKGSWESPLGSIEIDEETASKLIDKDTAADDSAAHAAEHSIEVQIPFIQHLFSTARIVPVLVPPVKRAVYLGHTAAAVAAEDKKNIVCIGSTDLTHYGPGYGFAPKGSSQQGLKWATEVNDKRLINLILQMQAEDILPEAAENHNACGAGAIAATIAFARRRGVKKAELLAHTDSGSIMAEKMGTTSSESVGYASIVF